MTNGGSDSLHLSVHLNVLLLGPSPRPIRLSGGRDAVLSHRHTSSSRMRMDGTSVCSEWGLAQPSGWAVVASRRHVSNPRIPWRIPKIPRNGSLVCRQTLVAHVGKLIHDDVVAMLTLGASKNYAGDMNGDLPGHP